MEAEEADTGHTGEVSPEGPVRGQAPRCSVQGPLPDLGGQGPGE